MRILCVHAHYDDYEFVASGLFELWRRKLGSELRARVIVCTDGQAGHHFRTREETGRVRLAEQRESARIGKYEFEPLVLPNGKMPREGCMQRTPELMAALWKAIRDFEPNYLFCPPIPSDTLAGVHPDHLAVAEAVRNVAYMINVPHAFTSEFPADETKPEPKKTPVILNLHDAYMAGENAFDLAIDVEEAFDAIADTSFCHQSQIAEWIPWVGRHDMAAPKNRAEWDEVLRHRFAKRNREMGVKSKRTFEFFTVTAWGELPELEALLRDFPSVSREFSQLDALKTRLARWRGED